MLLLLLFPTLTCEFFSVISARASLRLQPPPACHQPLVINRLSSTNNCHQPSAAHQLPPTNCHQPIVNNQLLTTDSRQPIVNNQLLTTNYHQLIVANQLSSIVINQLPSTNCHQQMICLPIVFSRGTDVRPGAGWCWLGLLGRRCAAVICVRGVQKHCVL